MIGMPGWMFPPTPEELLRERQEFHRRGAEAHRQRGHQAVSAARKRERQGRKAGRRR